MQLPKALTITITAIDHATRVLGNVSNAVAGVAKTGNSATGQMSGFMASLAGNLGAAAITSSLGAISQGFNNVKASIQGAIQEQTTFITSSAALVEPLGTTLDKAKGIMDNLQIELSQAAAVLPGENRDYIAVLNMLSDTVATQFKGDIGGFKDTVLDITKRTAALASTVPGLSGEAAGQTMEMLMSGNTMTSLKRLDLFQKNAPLRNALERQIKDAGLEGDKWTKATTKQRLEVIQKALKVAATDELFAEFEGTAESIIQSMKNKLIDMRTGIFGMMRKVDLREGRTVLDAFTEVLKRIRSLGAAGARLAKALGFSFDPMAALIDVFDGLNTMLGNITYQLDISTPQEAITDVITSIGDSISQTIRSAVNGMKAIDSVVLSRVLSSMRTLIGSIDWLSVGRGVGVFIWKLALALIRALPAAGKLVGTVINGILAAVAGLVIGILEAAGDSLYKVFVQPIVTFFDKVKQWFQRLTGFIPKLSNPFQGVGNVVSNVVNNIPGTDLVKSGLSAGAKLLGIGGDNKTNVITNPNADKVNKDNKVKPITPVDPKATAQPVSTSTSSSNTIQSLTIQATTPQDAQGIASTVIEELDRLLNFQMANSLA